MVMGEVVMFHILEEVAGHSPSGKLIVDIAKYRPMSRLGGNFYGNIGQVSTAPRWSYWHDLHNWPAQDDTAVY